MEIHSLKLFVTDADIAPLVRRHLEDSETIEDLQVRLTPEGVAVTGKYPTSFFKVAFETVWQISAAGPEIHVTLGAMRVSGMPANFLRGVLLRMVRDRAEDEAGVRVDDERVIINVTEVLAAQGTELRANFTAVTMSIGTAVIEAGPV